jgi:uncharacterized membrane protein
MDQNLSALPAGAGTLTGSVAPASGTYTATPVAQDTGSFAATGTESGYHAGSREIVVSENRTRPGTATVVGAAIAGAIAGGAIPFLLSGRAARSASAEGPKDSLVVESVIIARPARAIYDFWRDFTNLPQFMDNVKSVERLSETRSHWVIKAPAGTSVAFDSRVTDDVPGRAIGWESEQGASVPNSGRVEFIETAAGGSTNVRVTMRYEAPAGAAGRMVAKLFQREPSVQAREDLARLKALLEGGSVPA